MTIANAWKTQDANVSTIQDRGRLVELSAKEEIPKPVNGSPNRLFARVILCICT